MKWKCDGGVDAQIINNQYKWKGGVGKGMKGSAVVSCVADNEGSGSLYFLLPVVAYVESCKS